MSKEVKNWKEELMEQYVINNSEEQVKNFILADYESMISYMYHDCVRSEKRNGIRCVSNFDFENKLFFFHNDISKLDNYCYSCKQLLSYNLKDVNYEETLFNITIKLALQANNQNILRLLQELSVKKDEIDKYKYHYNKSNFLTINRIYLCEDILSIIYKFLKIS